jgi:hypothetical protein
MSNSTLLFPSLSLTPAKLNILSHPFPPARKRKYTQPAATNFFPKQVTIIQSKPSLHHPHLSLPPQTVLAPKQIPNNFSLSLLLKRASERAQLPALWTAYVIHRTVYIIPAARVSGTYMYRRNREGRVSDWCALETRVLSDTRR